VHQGTEREPVVPTATEVGHFDVLQERFFTVGKLQMEKNQKKVMKKFSVKQMIMLKNCLKHD